MRADRFTYEGYEIDPAGRRVVCHYGLDEHRFTEEVAFDPGDAPTPAQRRGRNGSWDAAWHSESLDAAARLVFLLAGVSYYKAGAPPVIDLKSTATTAAERAFLRTFYVEGLAEFAYRNELDLSALEIVGPDAPRRDPAATSLAEGRPLVPFGAGIDSIVTVEHVVRLGVDASLFVVSRDGDRFAAIEDAARVTGLPVVRAQRRLDPTVLRSAEAGFLNGHVPVTGILSAIAVAAAVLGGHDAVVMSNERSASVPTVWSGTDAVNHQWSKSAEFEAGFRDVLAGALSPAPEYFSFLRARSELWVARELAALDRYHHVVRSCNRAFAIDPSRRLDHWCGTCDKCCFVDLVLAPYLDPVALSAMFDGREPLADPALSGTFRALVGTGDASKPFECVGDEQECRAAAVLAAGREDRAGTAGLQALAADVRRATPAWGDPEWRRAAAERLLADEGADFVPPRYREDDRQAVR